MRELLGTFFVGLGRTVEHLGEQIRGPVKQPHPNDPSVTVSGKIHSGSPAEAVRAALDGERADRRRRGLFTRRG